MQCKAWNATEPYGMLCYGMLRDKHASVHVIDCISGCLCIQVSTNQRLRACPPTSTSACPQANSDTRLMFRLAYHVWKLTLLAARWRWRCRPKAKRISSPIPRFRSRSEPGCCVLGQRNVCLFLSLYTDMCIYIYIYSIYLHMYVCIYIYIYT